MLWFIAVCGVATLLSIPPSLLAQHPPPPPPPGPAGPPLPNARDVGERIERVRNQLESSKGTDSDQDQLLTAARVAVRTAAEALRENALRRAARLVDGADAFRRAAEHPGHIKEPPKGPRPQPQQREIADHLQRVYFRLQQADFFATTSQVREMDELPAVARNFYEKARQSYDRGVWLAADEYVKSADDTMHGLENLAQAAQENEPPPSPK